MTQPTTRAENGTATVTDKMRVDGVCKQFAGGGRRNQKTVRVLEGVSLRVEPGEIVIVTGPSGCGKTTLLRILMGLETVTAGTVTVDGNVITGPGPDRAMVFQHAELLPWRSALGNVEFALEARGISSKRERRDRARQYLELVGLGGAVQRHPYELSGGMRQRVSLARALATRPEILLMDEPFGALDAQTREKLQQELLRIHGDGALTIVFVTHDLDEAVLLADRVVMLGLHGQVHTTVKVDLPRPRLAIEEIRTSEEFVKTRRHLWVEMQAASEVAPVVQAEGR